MSKAKIAEIFCSVQGEGIYAGKQQLFVRFYGCTCSCYFCDTNLNAYDKYSPLELYHLIHKVDSAYHSLCLTGGEPLLQKDFLAVFLRLVKYAGITTYLETNGILAAALKQVIDLVDIIAMDFKLPSSTRMSPYWPEHRQFLKIALKKDVFIKIVICSMTEQSDLKEAIDLILTLRAKNIPVVLQPNYFELSRQLLAKTCSFKEYCSRYLPCVQVIPQLQKITGEK